MVAKSQVLFKRNILSWRMSLASQRSFNRLYSAIIYGDNIFESSIFDPRNQFNLLPHGSHTPAYVKAHKSFDRSDLFRNNEIIFFSCILLSLR